MDRNPHRKVIIFRLMIVIGAVHLYMLGQTSPIQSDTKSLISDCHNGQYYISSQEKPGDAFYCLKDFIILIKKVKFFRSLLIEQASHDVSG